MTALPSSGGAGEDLRVQEVPGHLALQRGNHGLSGPGFELTLRFLGLKGCVRGKEYIIKPQELFIRLRWLRF